MTGDELERTGENSRSEVGHFLQSPVSPVPLGTENWSGEIRPPMVTAFTQTAPHAARCLTSIKVRTFFGTPGAGSAGHFRPRNSARKYGFRSETILFQLHPATARNGNLDDVVGLVSLLRQ
jgi:hypothetical protein